MYGIQTSFLLESPPLLSLLSWRRRSRSSCCDKRIYYYYYLLKAHSPVDRTGSPQGFSQVQMLHKFHTISIWRDNLAYNIKHAHYTNVKHIINIIQKLALWYCSLKKMANKVRRCWYHWLFRSGVSIPDLKKEWTKTIANWQYYIKA